MTTNCFGCSGFIPLELQVIVRHYHPLEGLKTSSCSECADPSRALQRQHHKRSNQGRVHASLKSCASWSPIPSMQLAIHLLKHPILCQPATRPWPSCCCPRGALQLSLNNNNNKCFKRVVLAHSQSSMKDTIEAYWSNSPPQVPSLLLYTSPRG